MPETEKHAAAQQAVDILHEISTILVWRRLDLPASLLPRSSLSVANKQYHRIAS